MKTAELIAAARGTRPADLLITDARIVNVFSGEIREGHIAVKNGFIAGIGDYPAEKTVSVAGRYVAPGFIDAHVHIESAMTSVSEFVRAVLPHGTTAVVADPHEIANVLGTDGIAYMLAAAEKQPMNIYFTLPSCVPATSMETAGAVLDARALIPLMSQERIVALGEMMDFPGVIQGEAGVLEKIQGAAAHHKPVDGHSPGLSGKDLAAYLAAGIASDHECVSAGEAMEKLRSGMHIMIREGTGARNLADLLGIINEQTAGRIMWCTDDRHAHDILTYGHMDDILRKAAAGGVNPVTAIRMATLNPAGYFGLSRLGAIAPGRRADLVVMSDLERFEVETVYCAGRIAAQNGQADDAMIATGPGPGPASMHVLRDCLDFRVPAEGGTIRVISVSDGQIVTGHEVMAARIEQGAAVSDPQRDIVKLAVVERHKATGNIGIGFVVGFGLKSGAIAGSVAHDSHHIIAAGPDDRDLKFAVEAVIDMGGGLAVVRDRQVTASLRLPIAGLMSELPLQDVAEKTAELNRAAAGLGSALSDPFMALSFLALPVIPALKLTDRGLFDVERFAHVPLFVE
ncbi:MAG: adenine deaminase [Desulfobacteraceae bacterium]|nr:adenine deaminase [Desulfobacteraceae bacterium]